MESRCRIMMRYRWTFEFLVEFTREVGHPDTLPAQDSHKNIRKSGRVFIHDLSAKSSISNLNLRKGNITTFAVRKGDLSPLPAAPNLHLYISG